VLTGHRRSHTIDIVVDDDGVGVPVEERDIVLGRFARGSTAAPGGSGLGLALVTQQAELHGGELVLSDSPLGGLRATLTIAISAPVDPDATVPVKTGMQPWLRRANRVAGWRSSGSPPPQN
jgi:signal transduction histidine kinase